MASPDVVRQVAHVLAALRVVPLLRRVVRIIPAGAVGERQHRDVAGRVHGHPDARYERGGGHTGFHRGEQAVREAEAEAACPSGGSRERGEQEGTVNTDT